MPTERGRKEKKNVCGERYTAWSYAKWKVNGRARQSRDCSRCRDRGARDSRPVRGADSRGQHRVSRTRRLRAPALTVPQPSHLTCDLSRRDLYVSLYFIHNFQATRSLLPKSYWRNRGIKAITINALNWPASRREKNTRTHCRVLKEKPNRDVRVRHEDTAKSRRNDTASDVGENKRINSDARMERVSRPRVPGNNPKENERREYRAD